MKMQIIGLANSGDARGFSFTPPQAIEFLGDVKDIHLASSAPGAVRGNHYHVHKREAIILLPGTEWSLHWDDGEGSPIQRRSFDGSGAVLLLVSPECSHAVRNDGASLLWLAACSSEPYNPAQIVARKVV
jgi:dTDP-4-dehydrorhamnose 3,5-epimerase-like enzyme